jgi:hypothetical protein
MSSVVIYLGRNPLTSLRLLYTLSLFHLIFYISPATGIELSPQPSSAIAVASILQASLQPDPALFPHPPITSGNSDLPKRPTRSYPELPEPT